MRAKPEPESGGPNGREPKSAEDIALLINESVHVVPGMVECSISVLRLPKPDPAGCNWAARYSSLPSGSTGGSVRTLKEIIEHARRRFNLADMV